MKNHLILKPLPGGRGVPERTAVELEPGCESLLYNMTKDLSLVL